MIPFEVIDVGDPEDGAKSCRLHFHWSWLRGGAGRGLREGGRHRGVKSDVAFHLSRRLMNVAVQDGDRPKSSQESQRLLGVIGPPPPLRVNSPQRNVRENNNRRTRRKRREILL